MRDTLAKAKAYQASQKEPDVFESLRYQVEMDRLMEKVGNIVGNCQNQLKELLSDMSWKK